MANFPMDMDGVRAILSTYRDVHDTEANGLSAASQNLRSKLHQKNKNLESELDHLKEKYLILQRELINRDKKLELLNNQLIDQTVYAAKLQEDFENALEQLNPCHKELKSGYRQG